MPYVGRFAPSPTGPLHAGSVATALASYLHAHQQGGRWLLRIDDLDPPRCVSGSTEAIQRLLERLQLHWDGSVYYQRPRWQAHADVAQQLLSTSAAFRCDCARSRLLRHHEATELGICYDGYCRQRQVPAGDAAIRVRVAPGYVEFDDRLQGRQRLDLAGALGDYVIFRRDDLPAYHLATVLDDADQGISDVVRGCDLLSGTAVQVHLAGLLQLRQLQYWHVPILCNAAGEKLSKQHSAASVEQQDIVDVAYTALQHIGASPPASLKGAAPSELWAWALAHWKIEALAGQRERLLS